VGYVERHLLPAERVLYKTRLHWILYVNAMLLTLVGIILTGLLTLVDQPPWAWYVGVAVAVAGRCGGSCAGSSCEPPSSR